MAARAALDLSERTGADRAQRVQQLELVADRLSELVVEKERAQAAAETRLAGVEADLEEARLALAAARREADEAIIEAQTEHERAEEAIRRAMIAQVEVEASRAQAKAESEGEEVTLGEELMAIDDDEPGGLSLVPPIVQGEGDPTVQTEAGAWAAKEAQSLEVEVGSELQDGYYAGVVTVEIGPFSDFSQLVRFEDAAKSIAATAEIAVKRFSKGRATLEMRLTDPVELLEELTARTPFEFSVREQDADGLVLDLAA